MLLFLLGHFGSTAIRIATTTLTTARKSNTKPKAFILAHGGGGNGAEQENAAGKVNESSSLASADRVAVRRGSYCVQYRNPLLLELPVRAVHAV